MQRTDAINGCKIEISAEQLQNFQLLTTKCASTALKISCSAASPTTLVLLTKVRAWQTAATCSNLLFQLMAAFSRAVKWPSSTKTTPCRLGCIQYMFPDQVMRTNAFSALFVLMYSSAVLQLPADIFALHSCLLQWKPQRTDTADCGAYKQLSPSTCIQDC